MIWQPIKTAPRDGRNILIRFGQDGASQAKYIAGTPYPWQFLDTNDGVTWLINHAKDGPAGPSHWMPMPGFDSAPAPQAAQPTDLHNAIMNLPCNRTMSHFAKKDDLLHYKEGHRDARHAAAELALGATSPAPAVVQMTDEDCVEQDDGPDMTRHDIPAGNPNGDALQQLYAAWHREPCGDTKAAIGSAIKEMAREPVINEPKLIDVLSAANAELVIVYEAEWKGDINQLIRFASCFTAPTAEQSDLSKAILALPLPEPKIHEDPVWHITYYTKTQMQGLLSAAAALAKQVPAQEQDKIDAQRYRFLRHADLDAMRDAYWPNSDVPEGEEFDRCVDAAQLAQSADKAEG